MTYSNVHVSLASQTYLVVLRASGLGTSETFWEVRLVTLASVYMSKGQSCRMAVKISYQRFNNVTFSPIIAQSPFRSVFWANEETS